MLALCSFVKFFKSRVGLNRSWFVIHDKIFNFHDWVHCYHEPFHDKIKRQKSVDLSMDLWHLYNMKIILILWTLNYLDCVPSLYWFFPYCSQSSQLILKNLISPISKKHDQAYLHNLNNVFDFIGWYFELHCIWWNEMVVCLYQKTYYTKIYNKATI